MNTFFIRVRPGQEKKPTLIISISAKVAPKAVTRNRIRRVIRETLRRDIPPLKEGYEVSIIVKSATLPARQEIEKDLLVLLKKSGMLSQ